MCRLLHVPNPKWKHQPILFMRRFRQRAHELYTPHTIRKRTWRVLLYMHHPQTYDYIVCFLSSHWLNSALCNNATGSKMKTGPTSSTHLQVGWMLLFMLSKIWTQIKRNESTTSDYSSYIKDDPKYNARKPANESKVKSTSSPFKLIPF